MHCRRAPNKVENQVRPIFVKMAEKLRLVPRPARTPDPLARSGYTGQPRDIITARTTRTARAVLNA